MWAMEREAKYVSCLSLGPPYKRKQILQLHFYEKGKRSFICLCDNDAAQFLGQHLFIQNALIFLRQEYNGKQARLQRQLK